MVYPFAPEGTVEEQEPTKIASENALHECVFCKHNGWFDKSNPDVTCPRCGRKMERI